MIEEFFWRHFCDNYLEIVKTRSYGDREIINQRIALSAQEISANQQSALLTLHHVLNAILKLFAPFIPHITEELYSIIFADEFNANKSIHARGNWLQLTDFVIDQTAQMAGDQLVEILDEIRKIKSNQNLSIKAEIKLLTIPAQYKLADSLIDELKFVSNATNIVAADAVGCEFEG